MTITPTATTRVPVYDGMPASDRHFEVKPFGEIRCGGRCRDDYGRIVIGTRDGRNPLKLQRAAIESIHAAERKLGFRIETTGSWRSCAYQSQLYNGDHNRYAPPDVTAHCRGLAIDVSMNYSWFKRRRIRKVLLARGWTQARPTDEPWHYSFGIRV